MTEKKKDDVELTPTEAEWDEEADDLRVGHVGWKELWLKEDWWAIWVGLGIVLVAVAFFLNDASIRWIAIKPARWEHLGQALSHFIDHLPQYLAMFVMWLVVFSVAVKAMGYRLGEFIPSFVFVFVFSILIFMVGAWTHAHHYNLEPPLVALVLGMLISNLIGLPRWMDTGFRVEFYIKIGIVLLGATLPFTLIVWAGPVAIVQASIVSIATFLTIYFTAKKLGLDRRLGATLGAGGAVCGVSGAIAIAGAVGARKEHAPIAITLVILWAIVMIFFLPLVSRALGLHAGIAGAWVGTSEFADAAGFAAAQAYGSLAENLPGIQGTQDDAVWAFTLMKVVGRDIWIGIWAFVLALISTLKWERKAGQEPNPAEIWWRFPKFVIGFVLASIIITLISKGYSFAEYNKVVKPELVGPVKTLRTWAFIFCFFSIGLTTRFRELAAAGIRPFTAFTTGVVVNVLLGFVLSVVVFSGYWSHLSHG
ncbi:MAG: putative sulfate exporter family transporter [Gammaproteobacteria bacterium]|nr:MAG: putative sulfate exporter family transporter [Gammaproteobacteria bacterium]